MRAPRVCLTIFSKLCIIINNGASPSGKAAGFGPAIRRFESFRPSLEVRQFLMRCGLILLFLAPTVVGVAHVAQKQQNKATKICSGLLTILKFVMWPTKTTSVVGFAEYRLCRISALPNIGFAEYRLCRISALPNIGFAEYRLRR
jgi:hypothetical protein